MAWEVSGKFTGSKARPDTFNLKHRTELAQRHLGENCDRLHNCVPYVGATLGENPPHFNHHRLDYTEAMPYSIYGWVMARDITGSNDDLDIQQEQQELYWSFFSQEDGLIRSRRSPWGSAYPMDLWEQARALYAMVYSYHQSGDPLLLERMQKMVATLFRLSKARGAQRFYPVEMVIPGATALNQGMGQYAAGALIDPLVKAYEITADPKAYALAAGMTAYYTDPRNGFFGENGEFATYYRAAVATVNGISSFAALSGQPHLIERAKKIHDYAISLTTTFGSTPCDEPVCSGMELNSSALALISAGYDEYWDQIDRFLRNQIAEGQFMDAGEWVAEKAVSGKRITDKNGWVTDHYPANLVTLPYDDYRDVVSRCVGGFMWTTVNEHLYIPGTLMLCCAGHGIRAYHMAWRNALTKDIPGVSVNLHISMENNLGEVISHEPYEGKVEVILRDYTYNLMVRIPEYARSKPISALKNGAPVAVEVKGRYAHFGPVNAGELCALCFDLNPRVTTENHYAWTRYANHGPEECQTVPFETHWIGNTVTALLPQSAEEKRLYKMDYRAVTAKPMAEVSYFLSDNEINW